MNSGMGSGPKSVGGSVFGEKNLVDINNSERRAQTIGSDIEQHNINAV